MDKKGMDKWVLVGSILLLVVAAIFFIYLIKWKGIASSAAGSDVCKMSVLANVKTGGLINQNCKTIETTIKEDEEEKVKKEIANMMYKCWDQFGQGKLDVFGRKTPIVKEVVPTLGKIRCFVCHKFKVEKDIAIEDMGRMPPTKNGLVRDSKWFKENTYSKDKSYHDFFTQNNGQHYVWESSLRKDINYAIIFREVEGPIEIRGLVEYVYRKLGFELEDLQTVELRRFDELNAIPCETIE